MKTDQSNQPADRGAGPPVVGRVAYVRPLVWEGRDGFALFLADGSAIGWHENRDVAVAAAIQHDLEPCSVH